MDSVISDGGRKRRLPQWMVGVAAADQVSKKSVKAVGEGNGATKSKAGHSNKMSVQPLEIEELNSRVKCQSRGSKRKLFGKDDETSIDEGNHDKVENALPKVGIQRRIKKKAKGSYTEGGGSEEEIEISRPSEYVAAQEAVSRKRKKAKDVNFKTTEKRDVSLPDEEDEDLSVEDLMEIAEEILNKDKGMASQRSSKAEENEEAQPAAIASSRIRPGRFDGSPRDTNKIKEASFSNVTDKSTGEGTAMSFSRTGDPTKDMLDLLLGPLLKKAQ